MCQIQYNMWIDVKKKKGCWACDGASNDQFSCETNWLKWTLINLKSLKEGV